jgi:hypothetical protein
MPHNTLIKEPSFLLTRTHVNNFNHSQEYDHPMQALGDQNGEMKDSIYQQFGKYASLLSSFRLSCIEKEHGSKRPWQRILNLDSADLPPKLSSCVLQP